MTHILGTSRDILLKGLFEQGVITFDEYVQSLSPTSSMPKGELEKIIEARKSQINPQLMQILGENPQVGDMLLQYLNTMMGGNQDATQAVPQ